MLRVVLCSQDSSEQKPASTILLFRPTFERSLLKFFTVYANNVSCSPENGSTCTWYEIMGISSSCSRTHALSSIRNVRTWSQSCKSRLIFLNISARGFANAC